MIDAKFLTLCILVDCFGATCRERYSLSLYSKTIYIQLLKDLKVGYLAWWQVRHIACRYLAVPAISHACVFDKCFQDTSDRGGGGHGAFLKHTTICLRISLWWCIIFDRPPKRSIAHTND